MISNRALNSKGYITKRSSKPTYKEQDKQPTEKMF